MYRFQCHKSFLREIESGKRGLVIGHWSLVISDLTTVPVPSPWQEEGDWSLVIGHWAFVI